MSPDEIKLFCTILRKVQILRAERTALMTIVKHSVHAKEVPVHWKSDLEAIRRTPDYRAIAEEFGATISQLEAKADDSLLLRLLEQLGGDKLPN